MPLTQGKKAMHEKQDVSSVNENRYLPNKQYYRYVDSITINAGKKKRKLFLDGDCRISLIRDIMNKKGFNTIKIKSDSVFSDEILGIVPQDLSKMLATKMDEGTIYVGWIKKQDLKNDSLIIDIYERIVVSCPGITRLSFNTYGFLSYCTSFDYYADKKMMVYKKHHYMHDPCNITSEITFCPSPEIWNNFIQPALRACNFKAWEDHYGRNCIIEDGMGWTLDIWEDGKKSREISGWNSFPEEWDVFQRFIDVSLEICTSRRTSFDRNITLKDRLLQLRQYGVSPSKLAKALNVSKETIAEWEIDTSKIDGLTLMNLHQRIDPLESSLF